MLFWEVGGANYCLGQDIIIILYLVWGGLPKYLNLGVPKICKMLILVGFLSYIVIEYSVTFWNEYVFIGKDKGLVMKILTLVVFSETSSGGE